MKKKITCFGSGKGTHGELYYNAMERVGELLAKGGHMVVTGGYNGSGMEAPAKGAFNNGGDVLSVIPYSSDKVPHHFCHFLEKCGNETSTAEEQFSIRLGKLLNSDGFILDASGEMGTICELMGVINLSIKIWKGGKKLAILFLEAGQINNILITMVNMLLYSNLISDEIKKSIKICSSPEEAVNFMLD